MTFAAVLLLGAKGYIATPAGTAVLAPEQTQGGEFEVQPGDVVIRQAIVHASQAKLLSPLRLAIAGEQASLEAGTQLELVAIGGEASKRFAETAKVFCAPSVQASVATAATKAVVATVAFGLFGGLQRTAIGSRFCLIDNDNDGRVEWAVLAGAKRKADLEPVAIDPAPIEVTENVPIEGPAPSEVRLKYLGPVGLLGNVGFEVDVTHGGQKMALATSRAVASPKKLPKTLSFDGGASVRILSFDPVSKGARIRIEKPFDTGRTQFTPKPQTIYIYVPG